MGAVAVVDLGGGGVAVGGVRAALVEEGEVGADLPVRVHDRLVAFEIDLLVLEAAPEAFDEDVSNCRLRLGSPGTGPCRPSTGARRPRAAAG